MRLAKGLAAALLALSAAAGISACAGSPAPMCAKTSLRPADSACFHGDVKPEVFFRYMGWTGNLQMSAVNISNDRVTSGKLQGHAWMFVAIGAGSVNASTTTQTVTDYEFAVSNDLGQTIQLKLPMQDFVFYQNDKEPPHVSFSFQDTLFYTKGGGDNNSIFKRGEDSGGPMGNQRPDDDVGVEFSSTPPAVLIARYAASVNVTLSHKQFAMLNTPGINAVPLG